MRCGVFLLWKKGMYYNMSDWGKRVRSVMILIIALFIVIANTHLKIETKRVDISAMGDEVPVKVVKLSGAGSGSVYLLSNAGNIYSLCYSDEKYYVELWHPEFWNGIRIVDLCTSRHYTNILALDSEGNIYRWDMEDERDESTGLSVKKEDWSIQRVENIPKVREIFTAYRQIVIVAEDGNAYRYRWYPDEDFNLVVEDMGSIEMGSPILNIAATKEELFILDQDHVLWSVGNTENESKKYVQKDVHSIVQTGNGFTVRMMDDEIYVHNTRYLECGYDKVMFADRYEAEKVVFGGKISSMSVSNVTAVVCMDGKYYRWGKEPNTRAFGGYILGVLTYDEPFEMDLKNLNFYTVVGQDIIYLDEKNQMFILLQR